MATPLSADRLLQALRDEGLRVVEHRSWRNHNRNSKGPWGPVNGVMIHHTVTSGTQSSVELCYNGHSSLPGPLCHGVIAKDGTIYLVGHGRTNHAGLGDDDVLRAVQNETDLPADNEANTDGNRHFYGFECVNLGDGKDPWPEAQLEAIEKASAAICRAHGWSQRSVIGHKEWQPGKVDPRGFTMDAMRDRIAGRLNGTPAPVDPPAKPTTYTVKDGDTLSAIGKRLSIPWQDIATTNKVSAPYRIQPGQVLKLPGKTATRPPIPPAQPRYEPFPGAAFFTEGRRSPIVTAMGKRLVAEGCGRYQVGPGPSWSEADRKSYAAWQRKLGYTGSAADGVPGKASWDKLKVPAV